MSNLAKLVRLPSPQPLVPSPIPLPPFPIPMLFKTAFNEHLTLITVYIHMYLVDRCRLTQQK